MNEWLPSELRRMLAETPELSRAYLVGGCVRDWSLGRPGKDFDLEVFGVPYPALVAALARWGQVDVVGRSFGVIKLTIAGGQAFDFSLPRRDSKTAPGHKGFIPDFDPNISLADAASRRDFTINALAYDPRSGEVHDFFHGRRDLAQRVLRHTTAAFVEDPLRVLRGMQFAGRFRLTGAPETLALCRQILSAFAELPVERVRDEWLKWAAQSALPSAGLLFLRDSGWLAHFPEAQALVGTPQDPEWHPEGDVFTHTCHCLDELAAFAPWQEAETESRIVYMLAVLAHDFGKPPTTRTELRAGHYRIVSPEHDVVGVPLAERFLERLGAPAAIQQRVLPLVRHHLAHLHEQSPRSVRRLAKRLEPETIQGLCLVMKADHFGRPPKPRIVPEGIQDLLFKAAELELERGAPKPILMGRHLIARGLAPGPGFGKILATAFEAQLDGAFQDEAGALEWLDAHDVRADE